MMNLVDRSTKIISLIYLNRKISRNSTLTSSHPPIYYDQLKQNFLIYIHVMFKVLHVTATAKDTHALSAYTES